MLSRLQQCDFCHQTVSPAAALLTLCDLEDRLEGSLGLRILADLLQPMRVRCEGTRRCVNGVMNAMLDLVMLFLSIGLVSKCC